MSKVRNRAISTRLAAFAAICFMSVMTLNTVAHADDQTAEIELKADKITELAFFSVHEGKEALLGQEYFPQIIPIAAQYGGSMLGSFMVTNTIKGEINPQGVAIFEWNSLEEREVFLKDPDAKKLFPIRDEALSFIKLAYYTVEEDTTLTLKSGKTYEFFNAWLTPEAETSLPAYFKASGPIAKRHGSPKFIAALKPLPSTPKARFNLRPDMAGIVEWNNPDDYFAMTSDPEFVKNAEPLLEDSLSRIDLLQTQFLFPQQ